MSTITYDKNKSVILLDSGYILCHRYFATSRYLSYRGIDHDSNEFYDFFRKHLFDKLQKYKKQLIGDLILCQDSPFTSLWRLSIFPEYKQKRKQSINANFQPLINILHNVCSDLGIQKIGLHRLEADDVIALSVRKIREESHVPIYIITTDTDYIQLLKFQNIQIKNANLKDMKHGDPHIELWCKVLMGDLSDNIPSVFPKCGKKTALKLALDEQKRKEAIEEKQCQSQVDRNVSLISFESIPQSYVDEFNKIFNFRSITT